MSTTVFHSLCAFCIDECADGAYGLHIVLFQLPRETERSAVPGEPFCRADLTSQSAGEAEAGLATGPRSKF